MQLILKIMHNIFLNFIGSLEILVYNCKMKMENRFHPKIIQKEHYNNKKVNYFFSLFNLFNFKKKCIFLKTKGFSDEIEEKNRIRRLL